MALEILKRWAHTLFPSIVTISAIPVQYTSRRIILKIVGLIIGKRYGAKAVLINISIEIELVNDVPLTGKSTFFAGHCNPPEQLPAIFSQGSRESMFAFITKNSTFYGRPGQSKFRKASRKI